MKIRLKDMTMAAAIAAAIIAGGAMVASCGSDGKKGERKESVEALDSARNAGREAARRIIMREWTDSMAFQAAVLDARAAKSRYELEKRPQLTAAFDSAFISTIRTTRPDLARQLQ